MEEDKKLQDFIHKLYEIKNDASHRVLKPDQLKDIAVEVGITDEVWKHIQSQVENHLINGQAFLKKRNQHVALEHFERALELSPFHPEALAGSAEANYWLYQNEGVPAYKNESLNKANQCLAVVAGHPKAIEIISVLDRVKSSTAQVPYRKPQTQVANNRNGLGMLVKFWLSFFIALAAALIFLTLMT